jgi:hypothetical protein
MVESVTIYKQASFFAIIPTDAQESIIFMVESVTTSKFFWIIDIDIEYFIINMTE